MRPGGRDRIAARRRAIGCDIPWTSLDGVTVIPEVVVIDREGTVRLIKVGSGPDSVKAIRDMLEKLLVTPAGAEK